MTDTHATPNTENYTAPGGYRLGDFVPLHDFLAFPDRRCATGERWGRDEQGRLAFMLPESFGRHRCPLGYLLHILNRKLDWPAHQVMSEPGIAFPRIYSLEGELLPESRLGPKALHPDVAVYAGRGKPMPGHDHLGLPAGLHLVIELLSPYTWRSDLQRGAADEVDRWRSYVESGVAEYWIVNAGVDLPSCPLPPRSGMFLRAEDAGWKPLGGEGLRLLEPEVHGIRPVAGGVVHSAAIPGLTLDLDAFWRDLDLPG